MVMPSFTFASTANAFALRGARIRFAEVNRDTFSMEVEDVEDFTDVVQIVKVLIVGNGHVGKTSLARCFCGSKFKDTYKKTVGCDFYVSLWFEHLIPSPSRPFPR